MSHVAESTQKPKVSEPRLPEDRFFSWISGFLKLILLGALVVFIFGSWKDLKALLPRISHVKALGVEVEVSRLEDALRKQADAVKAPNVELQSGEIQAVLNRALRV